MFRLILTFILIAAAPASLADVIPIPPDKRIIRPIIRPVSDIYIRGIHYRDHSLNTQLSSSTVIGGQWFGISSTSLWFNDPQTGAPYDLRVLIQDVNRPPNSAGVTVYRLTNIRTQGMSLSAQAPNHPVLRGKSYHVTVFIYGQLPYRYANPGILYVQ